MTQGTSANGLLELVLAGQKRATTSSLGACEAQGMRPPRPGDLSIVTDGSGVPRCVIETTHVTVMPFCDMTFEICRREGEDDCLESWQRNHIGFFKAEAQSLGFDFTLDAPIVFEDFEVLYQV